MLVMDNNDQKKGDNNPDRKNDKVDNATEGEDSSAPDQFPVLPFLALTLVCVSGWPLLAVMRVGLPYAPCYS
jgi:hypothetical protein